MDYHLRPATATDLKAIRQLVWSAKLDPTQLRWQQFWVIEFEQKLIACGQLRQFRDAQELGSVVIAEPWRQQGLGSYLTQHLIKTATKPLYLECVGTQLQAFYTKFGFQTIDWQEVPGSLKFKFAITHLAKVVFGVPVYVMKFTRNPAQPL